MRNYENGITILDELINGGNPVMTDCERYGMSFGCSVDCPVYQAGKCEIKDEIKED